MLKILGIKWDCGLNNAEKTRKYLASLRMYKIDPIENAATIA
jgi:hypothetical protein